MPETQGNKVNPKLIVPFVKSAQDVFSTMAATKVTVGKPTIKKDPMPSYDISGIVGFSGEVVGSIVVSFHEQTSVKLVEAFAGEALEYGSNDFIDALGELCNMVAGAAKKDFGLDASISIPSVITGANHRVARMSDAPCLVIPCTTAAGEFAMEISVKQVSPAV